MEKDINLRRERVNGCLVFLLVLSCTPSVSNRSWLLPKRMLQDTGNTSLPVSFQQLVLHTPVNLLKERGGERGEGYQ